MYVNSAESSTVLNILGLHVPQYDVWAFGSRVHGRNLKACSDLDLVIIADKLLDPLHFAGLKEAFSGSDLPFRVHILNWFTLGRQLRQIIEATHEVLQLGRN